MGRLIELLPLSYTDAVVAIGAAILGLTCGVLGSFAVLRERSLVGDAIAHAALPGVCLAFLLTGTKDVGGLIVGAALAGIAAAVVIVAIEHTSRIRPDAAIGVVLASFFSLGIVLLTAIGNRPDANQAGLERYLFGQAAGLLERDLVTMATLACVAITVTVIGFRVLKVTTFDPAFSASLGLPVRVIDTATTMLLVVAVVIGVRLVGAILMVAMLIAPTVAARQFVHRLSPLLVLAALLGAGMGITGALLAAAAEVPTGPVIVIVAVTTVLCAILFAPRRGVLWRTRHAWRERQRASIEGTLLDLDTAMHAGPPPTEIELALATNRPRRALRRALRALVQAGLVMREGDDRRLHLTEGGAAAAHAMLQRRDLWSAWLEFGGALALPDAREPDPRDLRASLGDDAVEQLLAVAAQASMRTERR